MKKIILTTDSILARADDVVVNEVDGEKVMMRIESGAYYGLDSIGGDIWDLLDEPRRVEELLDRLVETYEGDPDAIRRDTLEFLESLAKEGLVRLVR
jgi:hypothetical protein